MIEDQPMTVESITTLV